MRFSLLVTLLSVFSVAAAFDFNLARDFFYLKRDDTTTDTTATTTLSSLSKSDTTVWVTITTNGVLATVKTIYSQSFMSTFTTVTASASSGEIGLGSLSGSVGDVRTYSETTVTNAGARNNDAVMYGGAAGAVLMVLGML